MSTPTKVSIAFLLSVFIVALGLVDTATGLIPDLAILYFIPIATAATLLGFPYALLLSILATAVDGISNLSLGIPPGGDLLIGTAFRFLVFSLGAVLIDRLWSQLRLITELEQRKSYDLEVAREVQQTVFTDIPDRLGSFLVGHKLIFAKELGGDYYYFSTVDDRLFFCLGDIAGKSAAAALFTAVLHQNIIDALEKYESLPAIVDFINSRVLKILPEDLFITMFASLIDGEKISYINAGHEPPLMLQKKIKEVSVLQSGSTLPLGIQARVETEVFYQPFDVGNVLLALTDGVSESAGFRDSPYEKLSSLLRKNANRNVQEIADVVFNIAVPDPVNDPPRDDVSIVCIMREA